MTLPVVPIVDESVIQTDIAKHMKQFHNPLGWTTKSRKADLLAIHAEQHQFTLYDKVGFDENRDRIWYNEFGTPTDMADPHRVGGVQVNQMHTHGVVEAVEAVEVPAEVVETTPDPAFEALWDKPADDELSSLREEVQRLAAEVEHLKATVVRKSDVQEAAGAFWTFFTP